MESAKTSLFFTIVACCIFNGLEGRNINASASSITTVKTVYGSTFKCVDIHKQPSLRHPALMNPQVKERIHKHLEQVVAEMRTKTKASSFYDGLWEKESCPIGTVPIEIMTKEKLEKARMASTMFLNHSLDWASDRTDFAGLVANSTPGTDATAFRGASAYINIYNPHVKDSSHQYSAASIILESDNGGDQIQVGWMVNPLLYQDQQTRLYTFWTADNRKRGCFNTVCAGFVQTSNRIPLGFVYPHISKPEYEQFDSLFYVSQVPWEHAWVLFAGDSSDMVGHWPMELFTSMKTSAQKVRFGGQVYTPPPDDICPPMGSGLWFQPGRFKRSCYMRRVQVEDVNKGPINPQDNFINMTITRCYFSASNGFVMNDPFWNYRFLFGGTGGRFVKIC